MKKYQNPRNPGSLRGVNRFYEEAREHVTNETKAQELLEQMNEYSVSKKRLKTFCRNPVVVTN